MGEIFYEKGKKYNCRVKGIPYFRTSVTIDGKRRQIYGDGEKDARRKVKELVSLSESGLNIDARSAKLDDVFRTWLFTIKRVDKNLKASSFTRYVSIYRIHIEPHAISKLNLFDLNNSQMQSYITELYEKHEVSNASISSVLKLWRTFTRWAVSQGYLVKNPCHGLTIPGTYDKKKKVPEFFTQEERQKIVTYMEAENFFYAPLIKLAFATGMRQGELLALRWEDIHEDYLEVSKSTGIIPHTDKDGNVVRYREVWDPKTKNSLRRIPLLPSVAEMLEKHKVDQALYMKNILGKDEPSVYVFTNKKGDLIDSNTIIRSYRTLLRSAEVQYRKFHAIRHTFGTEAIRRGVNVKDLQMLMGHADITTTYIYVHSDEKSKSDAVNLMGDLI